MLSNLQSPPAVKLPRQRMFLTYQPEHIQLTSVRVKDLEREKTLARKTRNPRVKIDHTASMENWIKRRGNILPLRENIVLKQQKNWRPALAAAVAPTQASVRMRN